MSISISWVTILLAVLYLTGQITGLTDLIAGWFPQ